MFSFVENGDLIDAREREILELRSRLNELMNSYDEILSNKSSLEFEINTYRRLLESEEAHVKKVNQPSPSIHVVRQSNQTSTVSTTPLPKPIISNTTTHQTEMQAKTTFQRSAKGF